LSYAFVSVFIINIYIYIYIYPSLYFGKLVVPARFLLVKARISMLGLFFSPFGMVLRLARSSFGWKPDSRRPAPRGGAIRDHSLLSPSLGAGPPGRARSWALGAFCWPSCHPSFFNHVFGASFDWFLSSIHTYKTPQDAPKIPPSHDFAGFGNLTWGPVDTKITSRSDVIINWPKSKNDYFSYRI